MIRRLALIALAAAIAGSPARAAESEFVLIREDEYFRLVRLVSAALERIHEQGTEIARLRGEAQHCAPASQAEPLPAAFVRTAAAPAPHSPSPAAPAPVNVLRVVDGDTLDVEAHVWPGIIARSRVRLAGVNTPESRGPVTACELAAGKRAKAFTEQWIAQRADRLTFAPAGTDKYGRLLGRISAAGEDLATALINAQLGRPYAGERRKPWCLP